MGRIQDIYLRYLPASSASIGKIIMPAHRNNLHGGVASAIAECRSLFWIPVLRKLTKSFIQNFGNDWKQFRATHYPNLKIGLLLRDSTEQALPLEIVSTNYVDSLYYKSKSKKDLKAYIFIFSCSVSRAVNLKPVSNLRTIDFIKNV